MATTPTKNAVPSESYVDLRYNSGVLDAFLNSQAEKFTDRLGNEKETLKSITVNAASAAQIEQAKNDAQASASAASSSASTASTQATNAASSASSASESANNAQQAATQAAALSSSTIVGESRNLLANLSSASATLTITADEIVVANALNGTHYRLPSFSKSLNVATTGLGGMDAGTAPSAGFVAIYAIYNPTSQTSALIATNATSSKATEVYSGSSMPSGYTASCLVMVWRTASSQLVQGRAQGRAFYGIQQQVVATGAASAGYSSVSASSFVPLNAIKLRGWSSITAATTTEVLTSYAASDASGNSVHRVIGVGYCGGNFEIPVMTAQTLFRRTGQTGSSTISQDIYITGYEV